MQAEKDSTHLGKCKNSSSQVIYVKSGVLMFFFKLTISKYRIRTHHWIHIRNMFMSEEHWDHNHQLDTCKGQDPLISILVYPSHCCLAFLLPPPYLLCIHILGHWVVTSAPKSSRAKHSLIDSLMSFPPWLYSSLLPFCERRMDLNHLHVIMQAVINSKAAFIWHSLQASGARLGKCRTKWLHPQRVNLKWFSSVYSGGFMAPPE